MGTRRKDAKKAWEKRKKKQKTAISFDTEEEKADFSALSTKLQIKEPYPKKIKDIFRDYCEKNITLQPEFQRDFIWSKKKQDELIRSLWRNIPLPMFYFSVDSNDHWEVIDGQQRLTTIFGYIHPTSIKDRKVRDKVTKKVKIEDENKNKISRNKILKKINKSNIYCVEISDMGLNPNDKFEIFKALNQGATPLKSQEIRNAIFQKEMPNLNVALKKNAKKLERLLNMKNERMSFEELILRFFIINEKGYEKKVSTQLNNINDLKHVFYEEKVNKINRRFSKFINFMQLIFKGNYFQALSKDKSNKRLSNKDWDYHQFTGKINQGLFHLLSYYLPQYDKNQINRKSYKKIREGFLEILKNRGFINVITGSGTDSTKNINKSKGMFERKFINIYLGNPTLKSSRSINREFKATMLKNIPYCYLCYGKLKRVEHIENFKEIHGEHIKSFQSGAEGNYKNMLLSHRSCNLDKGGKKLESYRKTKKSIKKRLKNKDNIKEYLLKLKEWNKRYPLKDYKKLIFLAKKDIKLKFD